MKAKRVCLLILLLLICGGCAGTGFEKKTTLVPDSLSIGYSQEKYKSDPHAWDGFSVSLTWTFK